MQRFVILMLIGAMALLFGPRPTQAHEMVGHAMTVETSASLHATCSDCIEQMHIDASGGHNCPHGGICAIFTVVGEANGAVCRTLRPVRFHTETSGQAFARSPKLDLPPPRIWATKF
ncbi:hypothetical protein [Celeribacter litoreus]|uniref:hypothetical protein n=1 Tax=Celeribacter litoreus TaxID=2876714 RepID=UPI001CCCC0FC|nr:hypothetical protein [Celeribacter litoreus]MCA0043129.1 hypothetical protein [Celeribacter litoreus]